MSRNVLFCKNSCCVCKKSKKIVSRKIAGNSVNRLENLERLMMLYKLRLRKAKKNWPK